MRALLVIDIQNDYCPGGAVPSPEGHLIVPLINDLMTNFELVIASRDWHPENSKHFEWWPPHCVRMSQGAEYHPDLNQDRISLELLKGTRESDDGYSAFEATNINLGAFLRQKEVDTLFIAGLSTETCVRNTVIDARDYGFRVFLVTDAIKPTDPSKEVDAIDQMQKAGAHLIKSDEIPNEDCD